MPNNSLPTIDLSQQTAPIDPTQPQFLSMLANLQGNILKSHGRDYALHLFIEFTGPRDKVKIWAANFTNRYVTSALRQMDESREYKLNGVSGRLFGTFLLSAAGYRVLGFGPRLKEFNEDSRLTPTTGVLFQSGMEAAQQELNDPDVYSWDAAYQGQKIHALIILADEDPTRLADVSARVEESMRGIGRVLACEEGLALRDASNKPIEHFGYRDGISQPLFFQSDVADVLAKAKVKSPADLKYDPSAGLDLVLVEDPLAPEGKHGQNCFGSYFVFRKLEQNVKGFKEREDNESQDASQQGLSQVLGLPGDEEERAGALVVGRFEDGVPVELSPIPAPFTEDADGNRKFVPGATTDLVDENNFNYHADPKGLKCPIHAHIRKTNPRGDTARVLLPALGAPNIDVETVDREERLRRIARRGITYGRRTLRAQGMPSLTDRPKDGVGLLFQCCQASIRDQFAFMQKGWCNSPDFAASGVGLDPVIGQKAAEHPGLHKWPPQWGQEEPAARPFDFGDFVTLKGGEFFFIPSIPFLRKLDGNVLAVTRDQKEFEREG